MVGSDNEQMPGSYMKSNGERGLNYTELVFRGFWEVFGAVFLKFEGILVWYEFLGWEKYVKNRDKQRSYSNMNNRQQVDFGRYSLDAERQAKQPMVHLTYSKRKNKLNSIRNIREAQIPKTDPNKFPRGGPR